ncbi:orotate phosphoribosyltransferase [Coniophora puteana RWD-64-598 SS2]|uniref:orotate phosphoribosyltransferase n=1 Tax=Coniophora puteana (strain RWD-64-598) TaxID=741705 RepID=R7SF15_CONPW|nr:orotate phosphoribosyltransferase [Coniophora puteana RWD-64-598 SS2]EIW74332.1 orotate phosphoribosyltransferase [Coniophora puteana RWD-64-598 SS2]
MSTELTSYQKDLLQHAEDVGALKFGTFTLKSGRISPYFINAGLLSTGPILSSVATAYAASVSSLPAFDVLFGPAYKGISFAACTALVLAAPPFARAVGFAYDRKEAKAHGEGGSLVGVPVRGKRVVVLDDVMTAGTAVRLAIEKIRAEGGEVVGVLQLLDREEVGAEDAEGSSTLREVERLVGGEGRVQSVLKMRDLIAWVREKGGREEQLEQMEAYRERYGRKD